MPQAVNDGSNPSQKQYPAIKKLNTAITLDILEDKVIYEEFKAKLKTALSKFPSSRKTKIVHELITKNIISLGLIHTARGEMPPVVMFNKENTLHRIFLDPDAINDSTGGSKDLLSLLNEFINLGKKINKEKKYITDLQIYNLESLNKEKAEIQDKLLNSVDWLKCIDLIYFGYLQLLAIRAVDKNQPEKVKVFKVAEELLQKQVQKIIDRKDAGILKDVEKRKVYNLGIQFFILTFFLQMSSKSALDILKNRRGEWVENTLGDLIPDIDTRNETPYEKKNRETSKTDKKDQLDSYHDQIIKELQGIKITSFEVLAEILGKLGVINITPQTMRTLMENLVGKEVYTLYYDNYPSFIALAANLNYKTHLFPKLFEIDDVLQKRIEELILNQKRTIVVKEKRL